MSKLGKLVTENFKILKAIEIDFDEDRNIYKLTGGNKQGKSSIIDSIWCGLCGKREFPDEPIRKGEDEFKNELYFDDLTVKRVYTENSHRLEVYDEKGNKYTSPQNVLNGLFNKIGLRPRKFVDADKEKQVEMLMDAVNFEFNKDNIICKSTLSLNIPVAPTSKILFLGKYLYEVPLAEERPEQVIPSLK